MHFDRISTEWNFFDMKIAVDRSRPPSTAISRISLSTGLSPSRNLISSQAARKFISSAPKTLHTDITVAFCGTVVICASQSIRWKVLALIRHGSSNYLIQSCLKINGGGPLISFRYSN